MKSIQFTVIIFILVLTSHAQNPHNGVYFGLPNTNVSIRDLVEYYDQGYYLQNLASTTSGSGSVGWNMKADINLDLQWDQFLTHSSGIARGNTVILDLDGNKYVGGIIFFDSPDLPFLAKFNACGEKEWCYVFPRENYGQGTVMDIEINNCEEIILLINYLNPASPEIRDRIFLIALDNEGKLLWEDVYASPDIHPLLRNPIVFEINELNNEYYLSGYCYYAYPSNPGTFYLTPFFIGIDSLFQEKWILPFGMSDGIRGDAFSSILLNDTIIMGVGYRRAGTAAWGLLMFYSTDGNIIGYSQLENEIIQPTISSQFRNIEIINDSLFMINGFYEPEYLSIYNMEFIVDASCTLYNYQPRPNAIGLSSLIKTSDDSFVVGTSYKVGNALSQGLVYKFDENLQSVPFDSTFRVYDSLCPYPIQSGTIDLTGCMVLTSTDWIPTPQEYYASIRTIPITIYPIPAKDHITFALENTEHHRNIELRCFNLLGMQQHQTNVLQGQKQATANVSNWPPGMYISVVYSDGKPVGRGKFVVQR